MRLSRYGEILPPIFLTKKLRKSIERLIPTWHHQRLRLYFENYGCLGCDRTHVIYGANGFCRACIAMLGKRIRRIDKELRAMLSKPLPEAREAYLRPYNSARRL